MSDFVVQLKTKCAGKHSFKGWVNVPCGQAECPGFTYTEVDLATALRAVLKTHPEIAREIMHLMKNGEGVTITNG